MWRSVSLLPWHMYEVSVCLQVCADRVNVLAGVDLVSCWQLRAAAHIPRNAAIVAATHAHKYLLLQLASGGAILLAEGENETGMEEVAASAEVLRSGRRGDVGACCLYEDRSNRLRDYGGDAADDRVCVCHLLLA